MLGILGTAIDGEARVMKTRSSVPFFKHFSCEEVGIFLSVRTRSSTLEITWEYI